MKMFKTDCSVRLWEPIHGIRNIGVVPAGTQLQMIGKAKHKNFVLVKLNNETYCVYRKQLSTIS